MSKEATGQFGALLGSGEYWSRINRSTIFADLMDAGTNYRAVVHQLGTRAGDTIEKIYEDLWLLGSRVRYLPSSNRNALAKQVEGLYDICRMAGVSPRHSDDCLHALNLSILSPWTRSFRDERGIERAISLINHSRYSGSEAAELLREAIHWSISSAAGRDAQKQTFLETVAQGNDSRFLQDVLEEYQHQNSSQRYEGHCGHTVGSGSYLNYMEEQVFGRTLPFLNNAASGTADYERLLRENLRAIADQLERDLEHAIRENDYITDQTADKLKAVVSELDHCGVSTGSLNSKIDKLAWFVGGDPAKIKQLQRALNDLGVGQHLEEDGVYGEKTQNAWLQFMRELENGTVPTLRWIDLLQSEHTGIFIDSTTSGSSADLTNALKIGTHPYIRFDPPHGGGKTLVRGVKQTINYNHINIDNVANSNKLFSYIQKQYDHYPLSDKAYKHLSNLKGTTKQVRIAGKVLLMCGIALDVLELGLAVNADRKDADKNLGKTTVSTAVSIGGSWAGAALLAKAGALLGAATGPAAPFANPILSLAGGIVGSIGGSRLAEYIVDITYVEN